jgi:hypothetical protein
MMTAREVRGRGTGWRKRSVRRRGRRLQQQLGRHTAGGLEGSHRAKSAPASDACPSYDGSGTRPIKNKK